MNVRKVTVLPRDQWIQINNRLAEKSPDEMHSEERIKERERLREKSKSVVKHWSNTIEGQRQRKLKAREERAEAEELELQRIDREEAKFQQAKRREAIDRAKTLQYYQTDRVKNFHRAMVLSEVLKERDAQLAMKAELAKFNEMRDTKLNSQNGASLKLQRETEEVLQERHRAQTLKVADYQRIQREQKAKEVEDEVMDEIEQGKDLKQADADYAAWLSAKNQRERAQKKQLNQDILGQIAGKKRAKELDLLLTKAEDDEINQFREANTKLAQARKAREFEMFMEKQKIRDQMLFQLNEQEDRADELENQAIAKAIAEQDAKDARRQANKKAAAEQDLADTMDHLNAEKKRLQGIRDFTKQVNEEDLKRRIQIDNDYLASEKEKHANRRKTAIDYQNFYRGQINQRATKERLAIDTELVCQAREDEARSREETEFQKYAQDVIKRAKDRNANIYPLCKAAQPGDGGGHGPVDGVGVRPSFLSTDGYGVQLPTYQKGSTQNVKRFYSPKDMEHAKKRFGFVW